MTIVRTGGSDAPCRAAAGNLFVVMRIGFFESIPHIPSCAQLDPGAWDWGTYMIVRREASQLSTTIRAGGAKKDPTRSGVGLRRTVLLVEINRLLLFRSRKCGWIKAAFALGSQVLSLVVEFSGRAGLWR